MTEQSQILKYNKRCDNITCLDPSIIDDFMSLWSHQAYHLSSNKENKLDSILVLSPTIAKTATPSTENWSPEDPPSSIHTDTHHLNVVNKIEYPTHLMTQNYLKQQINATSHGCLNSLLRLRKQQSREAFRRRQIIHNRISVLHKRRLKLLNKLQDINDEYAAIKKRHELAIEKQNRLQNVLKQRCFATQAAYAKATMLRVTLASRIKESKKKTFQKKAAIAATIRKESSEKKLAARQKYLKEMDQMKCKHNLKANVVKNNISMVHLVHSKEKSQNNAQECLNTEEVYIQELQKEIEEAQQEENVLTDELLEIQALLGCLVKNLGSHSNYYLPGQIKQ